MTWWAVVLLVVAVGLSAVGAVATREQSRGAPVETQARNAIAGLVLMAAALASAAVAGALLGSGRTGRGQLVAFAAVAAAVGLPLLVVRLARRRGPRPDRRGAERTGRPG